MKRFLAVLLLLAMVFSLSACQDVPGLFSPGFQAGFGRQEILPTESVPMMGHDRETDRMSEGVGDGLYATAVAIRDSEGNTVLLLTADAAEGAYQAELRQEISQKTGLPTQNIIVTVTGSQATPDLAQAESYSQSYREGLMAAALAAMEDLKDAKMYYTQAETEGLSVSRYTQLAKVPDTSMQLLKLDRGRKAAPIVMMFWQAAPERVLRQTQLSADFVGAARTYLETALGCCFAYFQGCAGDVEPAMEDAQSLGQALGACAETALAGKLVRLQPCTIRTASQEVSLEINHTTDSKLLQAQEVMAVYNLNYSSQEALEAGEPWVIQGRAEARAIIDRQGMEASVPFSVSGLAFENQLAIVTGAGELFSSTGLRIKAAAPFERVAVLNNANGYGGPIPVQGAYTAGTYEARVSLYGQDSAQRAERAMTALLQTLSKAEEAGSTAS